MARVRDQHGELLRLPGLAPVAIQQGHYAAKLISHRLTGRPTRPFRYLDKGNLATIGRGRAVAELGPIKLSGPLAWLIWLGVHIWYLIGHQNRLVVMMRWSLSFLSHGRAQGTRIIAGESPRKPARAAERSDAGRADAGRADAGRADAGQSGDHPGKGAVSGM
jgi:NADH dehydrogenase